MTPAPTLLEFPREIRQRIWHHLFTGSCIRTDVNADTGRRHALSTSYLPWQITATCVQTRRETLPLLVACIELHYTGTFETEALAQDVPDTYRRYIGAITYTRGSGNAGWWLLQSAEMAYHQLFPGVRRLHIDSRLLKCQVTVANEGDARKTLLAQAPACGPLVHLVMENSRHPFAEVISTLRSKRPASLTPLQVTFQASAIMQLDWKYLQEIYPQLRLRKYREKEAGAVEFDFSFDWETHKVTGGVDRYVRAYQYLCDEVLCGVDIRACGRIPSREQAEHTVAVLREAAGLAKACLDDSNDQQKLLKRREDLDSDEKEELDLAFAHQNLEPFIKALMGANDDR